MGLSLVLALSSAYAEGGVDASLFSQGRTRLSLQGGYGQFNDRDYAIVGLGAGTYLLNGLEAGVDGEAWLGSKPHLYSMSPRLTYTFFELASFHPYIGGFYRRTFYDAGYADINSVGGRAGVVTPLSDHSYLSAGLVYEKLFDCDTSLYDHCSQVYPELGLAFSY